MFINFLPVESYTPGLVSQAGDLVRLVSLELSALFLNRVDLYCSNFDELKPLEDLFPCS